MNIPRPSAERIAGSLLGRESRVAPGMADYDSARTVARHAREVHYDILRKEGFDADRAREISARSAEQQSRLTGEWCGGDASTPELGRSSFRTPYFGPHAGRLCRVLEDGSLQPVEEG